MNVESKRRAKLVLALYINGVTYDFGKKCEFCDDEVATRHCPSDRCGFVCDTCDGYRHNNSLNPEYMLHERAKVSKYDIPGAGFAIQGFFRFLFHRRQMREECRRQYAQFYKHSARRHYFCFLRTGEVTWHKPLIMGTENLVPPLTRNKAAFKMQQLHRNWKAREVARERMRQYYDRIYDPDEQRFYYHYNGKSPLIVFTDDDGEEQGRARWDNPCKSIGREWVWRPLLTRDMAAVRIQGMWKARQGRVFMRSLAREIFTRGHEPLTGRIVFTNSITGQSIKHQPLTLGSERWDPVDIMQWSVADVLLFIRRCGLKKHVFAFKLMKVDGPLLLTFDPEDFEALGVTNTISMKKILLCIEKHAGFSGYNTNPRDIVRRSALRKWTRERLMAIMLQRWWREMLRKMRQRRWKQTWEREKKRRIRDAKVIDSRLWWTERGGGPKAHWGLRGHIKTWGPRKLIHGARGWGYWRGREWVPAPQQDIDGERTEHAPTCRHESRLMYTDVQRQEEDVIVDPVNFARAWHTRQSLERRVGGEGEKKGAD